MFTILSGSFVKRTSQVGLNIIFLVLKLLGVIFTNDPDQGHIVLDKVFAYKSICWAKEFVMEFVCVSGWTEKC